MATRRLYYEDRQQTAFTATVLSCTPTGTGYEVILDRTAFYPEGGGQACDLGTLGTAQVLDVQEKEEQVVHLCDCALEPGALVDGCVQWQRRFDLMQQHTGEHILSGLIFKKYGYQNSGFHVGKDVMEVDFDGPIPSEDLWALEEEANALIWQNLPVHCYYPAREELPHIPYRTKRALPWPVRIVEIPGGDICACCGIHVAFTGQVGLIKILSCVALRGGVRLELVCGQRAYRYMAHIFGQNREISRLLSAKMPETAAAVQSLQTHCNEEKYRAGVLQKKVFEYVAAGYAGQSLALHFEEGLNSGGVRDLAQAIGQYAAISVVCSGSDDTVYSICIYSEHTDVSVFGKQAIQSLNGRGGGKKEAVQGTVHATRGQIVRFFEDAARSVHGLREVSILGKNHRKQQIK